MSEPENSVKELVKILAELKNVKTRLIDLSNNYNDMVEYFLGSSERVEPGITTAKTDVSILDEIQTEIDCINVNIDHLEIQQLKLEKV